MKMECLYGSVLLCLGCSVAVLAANTPVDNPAGMDEPEAVSSPRSFRIPAWAFDRGNAKTFTQEWADDGPMVAFGGRSPIFVEYDIEFPATGNYTIRLLYAAATARPVQLLVDGKSAAQVCRAATGSWNTSGAQWEESCQLYIGQGLHTFRLQRTGDFPHVASLEFASAELPPDWIPNRPNARKLGDPPPALPFEPYQPEANVEALRRAIVDLTRTYGSRYPEGAQFLSRLQTIDSQLQQAETADRARAAFAVLQREALLRANPLLDFSKLLLVKRNVNAQDIGLPYNWQSNSSLPKEGYDNAICLLPLQEDAAELTTLFQPERDVFVGDLDLHYDAGKLLFSSVGTNGRWQVFELTLRGDRGPGMDPGHSLRQLTGEEPDVDSYDACYLPDNRIIFTSTACLIGVPCVYGSSHVATLYRMEANGGGIRQLCFDQEHDWCPTVLNNGRVLYTRWEYADTPHANTRLLFHMNPDGTGQMEFLGSNSYWPNSIFYARPVPGHPTMVAGIVGGHHDPPRMGELVLFDPARGRQEASSTVQRIPGHGQKVDPLIRDGLTAGSWPKFLHPYPLSEKYFLTSCKPTPDAPWGVYLVDVFDNLVPIKQLPHYALLEPIPLRVTPPPPVIPDKVDLSRKDALVLIQDIYAGNGLRDVPRGQVKALRLFTYHFAYQNMGGLLGVVGADGPWDIKRVLGTVPVYPDGSAMFRVPANTPISLQPLDEEGKALQLMRSWMTAMPGESVQCVGCHERQNTAPPARSALAFRQPPAEIEPWYGPTRGFSFPREVQPVLDAHCVPCHNGQPRDDGLTLCNLRGDLKLTNWSSVTPGNGGAHAGKFSVGYAELHRYVRRPGIESDYHMLEPMEFHADTTHLVQLLQKGHHGVQLDAEAWDRLVTWIDLNCPYHGTWGEEIDQPGRQRERRRELLRQYAGVDDDPEAVRESSGRYGTTQVARASTIDKDNSPPHAPDLSFEAVRPPDWPFDSAEAKRRQAAAQSPWRRTITLQDDVSMDLVLVPAGAFVMGSLTGQADERPWTSVSIEEPFWMAAREVDNRTYALFDPTHDSRVETKNAYQFGIQGYPLNQPEQPVVRISWRDAMRFCQWLSARTGQRFTLPTEAQWEYACRAGTATPFHYGQDEADFSPYANLADAKLSEFASDPYTVDVPLGHPTPFDDWIPKESRFNDGALVSVPSGRYQPNAWGLHDMHGNVAEWTRSTYAPYPYAPRDGRDAGQFKGRKVARGGSWRDLPDRATASFRLAFPPWQRVYNVGFRVVCIPSDQEMASLPSR